MDKRFMGDLAEKINDEFEKEYAELSEIGKSFSPTLDAKLMETARFYGKKYVAGHKKNVNLRMLKKVAFFCVCFCERSCNGKLSSLQAVCISNN